jgi:hypothetical protein
MDDSMHSRRDIGKYFLEEDWTIWFASYSSMIRHYLELAAQNKVELFSIGTELTTTGFHLLFPQNFSC